MAVWNEADLHAVHVVDPTWLDHLCELLGIDQDRLRSEAAERARAAAIDVAAEGEPARGARVDVLVGSPAGMLVQVAKSDEADLIVLGVRSPTSGGSDGPRGPGPVAASCVRHAPTKVLLVREDQPGGAGPYRVIVACVDFSETSLRAVQQAVRVAQQDKAALRIVHVAMPPRLDMAYAGHPLGMWPGQPLKVMEMWNAYRAELMPRLEAFVAPLRPEMAALDVTLDIAEHEHYGRGIAAYVREHKAGLVVLGTRGRTNLRDVLLGSTAERVLADLPCSALTVKPADSSIDLD